MAVRPLAVTNVETGVVVGTGVLTGTRVPAGTRVLVGSRIERIALVTAVNLSR
ncbi:hypothetical protein M878_10115 [Streptomyces roseochromogenus subsp. oscitans DS 12.976]|uniref:Uncharacterized protein n=1 Tax=Streptomyces roseochromogenus subsp. oscitans DS 12.976 TaxID=1352936 RepID=V6KSG4_STRRC|nr:hypothetical protein M878_10115 [Streptomyces roseochromogenus subsp. oscitans DS 12.976]